MSRRLARRLVFGVGLLLTAMAADWRTPPRGEGPARADVRDIEGIDHLGVNDLARLLDATKFWRGDLRRLTLRTGPHTITLTDDAPFAVVDDSTVWLGSPVRSLQGELQVPVSLIEALPSDSTVAHLFHDPRRRRVIVLPASGGVGSPRVTIASGTTRLVFPADRADQALVVARSRAHFRLRFGGVFTGGLPDSFPDHSLVRSIRPIAAAGGGAFELEIAPQARGFRLLQDDEGRRVTLEVVGARGAEYEDFAPEGPEGPRALRVIVLDPGHGGTDPGVIAHGAVEKDLTLMLARLLERELERTMGARVLLTREDDREVGADARAEIANRVRADLVLSLHFDGFVSGQSRGATGYCPPATFAAGAGTDEAGALTTRGAMPITLLPWRDVAARHAVQSRALAEAILSALELRGQGPTRLRERLPHDLRGVNAPGILLECATLTAATDRERVTQEVGLRELAAAIASGIEAYQRAQ